MSADLMIRLFSSEKVAAGSLFAVVCCPGTMIPAAVPVLPPVSMVSNAHCSCCAIWSR